VGASATSGRVRFPLRSTALKLPQLVVLHSTTNVPRSTLHGLLELTWRYRGTCLRVFADQVFLLALNLGAVSLSGLCVDVLRYALQTGASEPKWPFGLEGARELSIAGQLSVVGGAVVLLGALYAYLTYHYTFRINEVLHMDFVPKLRQHVFERLQVLGPPFLERHGSGALINRVTGDVQSVRSFVDQVLLRGAVLVVSLVVFSAYMLRVHLVLAALCLAPMPAIWFVTRRFSARTQPGYTENRALVDEVALTMNEGAAGMAVTKAFGREKEELSRFAKKNDAVFRQAETLFGNVSQLSAWLSFFPYLSSAALLGYGGLLVARGELSLGNLVVFAGLLGQFATQVGTLAQITNTLQQSLAGAERVFEVIDAEPVVHNPTEPRALLQASGHLRCHDVVFGYPGGAPVLKGVSLEIRPGQCVALLGPTGSGKSTLLKLIMRTYDVSGGAIHLDGRDVRELDLQVLRSAAACVFQDTQLFRGTVAENIAFGYPDAPREAIERAARLSSAHEFIAALPQGYDTYLRAGGGELSGGQRQRLALARAVLPEPPLLLLDDPTAALDPRTESDVLAGLAQTVRQCSTLLVTGRLSTCRIADYVYVLENGAIVDAGTPQALQSRPGLFQRIALLQGVAQARGVTPGPGVAQAGGVARQPW
jgi:ABC-type multidrug transport system fused ATPase/permease subunit